MHKLMPHDQNQINMIDKKKKIKIYLNIFFKACSLSDISSVTHKEIDSKFD